jgi:hypothetical protein
MKNSSDYAMVSAVLFFGIGAWIDAAAENLVWIPLE